ncbi:uncharacterized protein N7446_012303 [Penicillium canescens]|uniref:uncharacterized protein n=1 Tax=Penicillium canescens TaxID=5083 RepID=UPI0026E032EA|nr:uncharacterized protein N7446_012303 [Penicillium canescens]KAJ6045439.1 hypothetical protein N7446_012303 [Penicillium canescens]
MVLEYLSATRFWSQMGSRSLSSEFRDEMVTGTSEQTKLFLAAKEQYTRLVQCEKKCLWFEQNRASSTVHLPNARWQRLITLHLILLYEHERFFLMCQHPSANPSIRDLPEKYAMPGRMWRYGIRSLLDILQQNLPQTLGYIIFFIETVSSILKQLVLTNSALGDSLFEQLGDLALYRAVVEKSDRKDWEAIPRYWYQKAADRNPDSGQLQHRLAACSRSDPLKALFYLTKALISVQPFPHSRVTVGRFFDRWDTLALQHNTMATSFIAAHYVLLTGDPDGQFMTLANGFLSLLPSYIQKYDYKGQHIVYIMSCNFASVLRYGELAFTTVVFPQSESGRTHHANKSGQADGIYLTFETLSVLLRYSGSHDTVPGIHICLAFLCISVHRPFMENLGTTVPWRAITRFLNGLFTPDAAFLKIEEESFPIGDDGAAPWLPEDYLICGQVWSQSYYPTLFSRMDYGTEFQMMRWKQEDTDASG